MYYINTRQPSLARWQASLNTVEYKIPSPGTSVSDVKISLHLKEITVSIKGDQEFILDTFDYMDTSKLKAKVIRGEIILTCPLKEEYHYREIQPTSK